MILLAKNEKNEIFLIEAHIVRDWQGDFALKNDKVKIAELKEDQKV